MEEKIFKYIFHFLNPRSNSGQRATIWTNLFEVHRAMLHIKFQATEPSGSEEEDFWIFFYAFLWFKPETLWPLAMLDPETFTWTNLVKSPLSNDTEQIWSIRAKWFWRRFLFYYYSFFNVFLLLEPRTPRRGAILDPETFIWTNLVKDYQAIVHQVSSTWAKWFWRRRFFNILLCISMVWTSDPLPQDHLGFWDLHLNMLGKRSPGNISKYTKFQAPKPNSSGEEDF